MFQMLQRRSKEPVNFQNNSLEIVKLQIYELQTKQIS